MYVESEVIVDCILGTILTELDLEYSSTYLLMKSVYCMLRSSKGAATRMQ